MAAAPLTPEKFKVIGYTEEDANRIDRPTISTGRTPGDGSAKTRSQWDLLLCSVFCLSWSSSDRISKDMIMLILNIAEKNQGVSSKYWFGTDNLGRDLFKSLGRRAGITDHRDRCNGNQTHHRNGIWRADGTFRRLGR